MRAVEVAAAAAVRAMEEFLVIMGGLCVNLAASLVFRLLYFFFVL